MLLDLFLRCRQLSLRNSFSRASALPSPGPLVEVTSFNKLHVGCMLYPKKVDFVDAWGVDMPMSQILYRL